MTRKVRIAVVLVAVVLLVGAGVVVWKKDLFLPRPVQTVSQATEAFGVRQRVGGGAEEQVLVNSGESALAVLERTHKIALKKYSFGDMVEGIDGVANGTDGKYWIYYVNGKTAEVGAGQYKLKKDDAVEWRFEKEQK